MDLYSNLKFEFTEFHTDHIHLSEEEWKMMIMVFCLELADKPTSRLLIEKLIEFTNNGYSIKIANYDTKLQSTYVYPKIRYEKNKSVLIIIPSVPYFVDVHVLGFNTDNDNNDDNDDDFPLDSNLFRVSQYLPSYKKLESVSSYKGNKNYGDCIEYDKMPPIIGFAHELVHCLRHFEQFDTDNSDEEYNTIYGIGSKTLKYNIGSKTFFVTENTIRKDFGFKPRVSHDSKEVYCWRVTSTYTNSDKFTKKDFFN
jgi:hypothetical protein